MSSRKNIQVQGDTIDNETRCTHYHTEKDIVAIKFPCCDTYYSCYYCHENNEDHTSQRWRKDQFEEKAVLCGHCDYEMSITEYLTSHAHCPSCGVSFNPSCAHHHQLYFDV